MEINKNIFLKHLEQAAIEQLALKYEQEGFDVTSNYQIKEQHLDLVVKKGDEIIAFEIKAGTWDTEKQRAVHRLRNLAVHELGAKFKLIFVNLPEEPEIEIEGLEEVFQELLAFPSGRNQ